MELVLSPQHILQKLVAMGCTLGCLRQTLTVEGRRYRVLRQLAEGGFSTVELVEDCETGKRFAVKRIVCHSIEDQNMAQREVEVTRALRHPNIVRVVGAATRGAADIYSNLTSEVLVVFPLYKQSLHEELVRREAAGAPLPTHLLLSLFAQICSAVRELHRSDPPLAHRDIKPHNVLLGADLAPVLMDFGSAAVARVTPATLQEAAYLQDTAAERCSMTYRPPELFHVATGAPVDERTDIWSLGCLLYALIYFKGPFDAVYEKGDSVALAVQGGAIELPDSGEAARQGLRDLVIGMTNLDINFRMDIDAVLERVAQLQEVAGEEVL